MGASRAKPVKKGSGRSATKRKAALEAVPRERPPTRIVLRTDEGEVATLNDGPALQQAAMAWNYKVRNRIRWNTSDQGQRRQAEECRSLLVETLGVPVDAFAAMARRGIVEVSIPYTEESAGWAARIMPWEYVLTSATRVASRDDGGSAPLTVVRHIARTGPARRKSRRTGALIVVSAPGRIEDLYDVDSEAELMKARVRGKIRTLKTPTLNQLRSTIAQQRWSQVHVGGVDSHQGASLLEREDGAKDGWLVADGHGGEAAVDAEALADVLNSGDGGPDLVVFNLYHSASRVAALTVAGGTGAALGFQDTFDDLAAELFIGEFYRAWQSPDDAMLAFQAGWVALRQQRARRGQGLPLTGSGIVLWSARSLVSQARDAQAEARKRYSEASTRSKSVSIASLAAAQKTLDVKCDPLVSINYSLLHNQQPLFANFKLRNLEQGRIESVRVDVELDTGEHAPSSFRWSNHLEEAGADLAREIFVPLTSALTRSLEESLMTALRVRVSVRDYAVFDKQYPVTLLPYNEWVDDDQNRQFLPSFVWPLDPAVRRIVAQSQRYLAALADDPAAGFDGYQNVDEKAEDPTACVDYQVAALWRALLDEKLGYINPPPSYTKSSQRLRTPSRIIEGGRGTCIDLALLLIACLEYVEIYPVMFLLDGHAFPGYWRSDTAWEDFVSLAKGPELSGGASDSEKASWNLGNIPWMFPSSNSESVRRSAYKLVREQVEKGNLVPLEAVWLTTAASFGEAKDDGWDNLAHPSEFESMIDIRAARAAKRPVTPLPVLGGLK